MTPNIDHRLKHKAPVPASLGYMCEYCTHAAEPE